MLPRYFNDFCDGLANYAEGLRANLVFLNVKNPGAASKSTLSCQGRQAALAFRELFTKPDGPVDVLGVCRL